MKLQRGLQSKQERRDLPKKRKKDREKLKKLERRSLRDLESFKSKRMPGKLH